MVPTGDRQSLHGGVSSDGALHGQIGRRKLIVPLYRDLAATPEGKALATKIYDKARDGYHADDERRR